MISYLFTRFPPVVTPCVTVLQYRSQDIGTTYRACLESGRFTCTCLRVCMCIVLCSFVTGIRVTTTVQVQNGSISERLPCATLVLTLCLIFAYDLTMAYKRILFLFGEKRTTMVEFVTILQLVGHPSPMTS